ncbi:putative nuclease HARBI1 [Harpegnathos saltator]|uniref:putative nuclease HARBI1 n=1 Tax=Harpegnathos saltator TaxID=610380 RepID=UPI000DBEEB0C|nr:putative nuclease HARBI1 [Harpegnathos saltator]XP_025157888.1 putative nuclease HARBI1 [Harpegnathos saltator]
MLDILGHDMIHIFGQIVLLVVSWNDGICKENARLIGDDGYGLEPWLMTPLKYEQPGTPCFNYNEELCSTRSCIERLFGVLKSEFRCLSAQRQLMYEPGLAGRIVNACAVLHNMRIHHRIYDIDVDPAEVEAHRVANMPNPAVEISEALVPIGKKLRQSIFTSLS